MRIYTAEEVTNGTMEREERRVDGTEEAISTVIGNVIRKIYIEDDTLYIESHSPTGAQAPDLLLWDSGQSCCEHRYMHTDDDLSGVVGGALVNIDIVDGPDESGEYGDCKESQFLKIYTTIGTVTVVNYNEHNGYYGGFCLRARLE